MAIYHLIQPSRTMESILQDAKLWPLETFERYPIDEVRKACLKAMQEREKVETESQCNWAEDCIYDLIEQYQWELLRSIVTWYIHAAKGEYAIERAFSFTISLTRYHKIDAGWLSKPIAAKVNRAAFPRNVYFSVLKPYLRELINFWKCDDGTICCPAIYSEKQWNSVDRAVQIVALVEDFSFLDDIETLLFHIKEGIIGPDSEAACGTRGSQVGKLTEIKELLLEKKRKMEDIG